MGTLASGQYSTVPNETKPLPMTRPDQARSPQGVYCSGDPIKTVRDYPHRLYWLRQAPIHSLDYQIWPRGSSLRKKDCMSLQGDSVHVILVRSSSFAALLHACVLIRVRGRTTLASYAACCGCCSRSPDERDRRKSKSSRVFTAFANTICDTPVFPVNCLTRLSPPPIFVAAIGYSWPPGDAVSGVVHHVCTAMPRHSSHRRPILSRTHRTQASLARTVSSGVPSLPAPPLQRLFWSDCRLR